MAPQPVRTFRSTSRKSSRTEASLWKLTTAGLQTATGRLARSDTTFNFPANAKVEEDYRAIGNALNQITSYRIFSRPSKPSIWPTASLWPRGSFFSSPSQRPCLKPEPAWYHEALPILPFALPRSFFSQTRLPCACDLTLLLISQAHRGYGRVLC